MKSDMKEKQTKKLLKKNEKGGVVAAKVTPKTEITEELCYGVASTLSMEDDVLTMNVVIKKEDYEVNVAKKLEKIRKKASMKGFREGSVPISIIKRMYGGKCKHEEISRVLQRTVEKHIKLKNVNPMGAPMVINDNDDLNWDIETEFSWDFEVGITPEFSVECSRKDKINRYEIIVDDEVVNRYKDDMLNKYGVVISPDSVEDNDMVFCQFVQIDDNNQPIDGGITHTSGVDVSKIKNIAAFKGVKRGEKFWVRAIEITDNTEQLMQLLGVKDKQTMILALQSRFSVNILTINRHVQATMNTDFFEKVYGKGSNLDEKSFMERLKADVTDMLNTESDVVMKNDAIKLFSDKTDLKFSTKFLKKWFVAEQTRMRGVAIEEENVDKEFDSYLKSLTKQMIEGKMAIEYKIMVTNEMLNDTATKSIKRNMELSGTEVTDVAVEANLIAMMSDMKERNKVRDAAYQDLFCKVISERCTVKTKKISFDEFYKMVEGKEF